jgi:hypothetical protein
MIPVRAQTDEGQAVMGSEAIPERVSQAFWDRRIYSNLNLQGFHVWANEVNNRTAAIYACRKFCVDEHLRQKSLHGGIPVMIMEPDVNIFFEYSPGSYTFLRTGLCRDISVRDASGVLTCTKCVQGLGGYEFKWNGPWTPSFASTPPALDLASATMMCSTTLFPQGTRTFTAQRTREIEERENSEDSSRTPSAEDISDEEF